MDAKQIADWFCSGIGGIGTKQESHLPSDCNLLKEIIAYGEVERKAGREEVRTHSIFDTQHICEEATEKAEAEGYRRGVEEAAKVCEDWPNQCLNCAEEIAK